MNKLKFIFTVFVIVSLLAACGKGGTSENGSSEDGKENVNIWYYYSGKQQELFVDLIEEYNNSQDKYNLIGEYVPFADTKKQLSVGVAGGTLPDLVILDVVDNAAFAAQGVLEDITEKVEEWGEKDSLLNGPLESATYDGKIYGLPLGSNALGLFYNEDLLEEAGVEPPKTWDELIEAAKKLTNDETKGFAMSAVKSEESTFQYYPLLLSSGEDYTSLDSDGAVRALELMKTLVDDGSMSSDVVNSTQDDIARQFAQGDLAMMINGSWNIERIKGESPDLNFNISQVPMDKEYASTLGGENLALVKGGNVEGAFDFAKWLLEPERIEEFSAETGVFPGRQDVLATSDFWNNDKHLKEFVPILEIASPRGPSPEWPSISEAIQIAIQETLTGTKSAQEALDGAAKKVDEIINK